MTGDGEPPAPQTRLRPLRRRPPVRDALTTVWANLTFRSTAFRHALRLALTVGAATAVYRLFELPRGPILSMGALQHFRIVGSRPFFHPVHTLPPYATGQHLPVAEHLASRGMNLPSGTGLGEADVERRTRG